MKVVIKKKISTIIFIFWILFVCANHIHTGNANLHLPVAIVGTVIFVWAVVKNYYMCRRVLGPIVIFFVCALVSVLFVRNVPLYYLGFILGHIGIALGLALTRNDTQINYKHWFFIIILFYFIYYFRYQTFDTMYNLASENMVSVYLLLIFYLYYRANNATKFATAFFATASLILGYLSGSRTGLGCLLLLFIGLFIIRIMKMRNGKSFIFLVILTGIIGTFAVAFFGASVIQDIFYDSPRAYIWNLYMSKLTNTKALVFGAPFSAHQAFAYYINNLHNTFMNVHARFGLFPLVTIIYILYKCIRIGFKENRWHIVLFAVLYILRSLTDNTSFSGPLDVLIYTVYFDLIFEQNGYFYGESE